MFDSFLCFFLYCSMFFGVNTLNHRIHISNFFHTLNIFMLMCLWLETPIEFLSFPFFYVQIPNCYWYYIFNAYNTLWCLNLKVMYLTIHWISSTERFKFSNELLQLTALNDLCCPWIGWIFSGTSHAIILE